MSFSSEDFFLSKKSAQNVIFQRGLFFAQKISLLVPQKTRFSIFLGSEADIIAGDHGVSAKIPIRRSGAEAADGAVRFRQRMFALNEKIIWTAKFNGEQRNDLLTFSITPKIGSGAQRTIGAFQRVNYGYLLIDISFGAGCEEEQTKDNDTSEQSLLHSTRRFETGAIAIVSAYLRFNFREILGQSDRRIGSNKEKTYICK